MYIVLVYTLIVYNLSNLSPPGLQDYDRNAEKIGLSENKEKYRFIVCKLIINYTIYCMLINNYYRFSIYVLFKQYTKY